MSRGAQDTTRPGLTPGTQDFYIARLTVHLRQFGHDRYLGTHVVVITRSILATAPTPKHACHWINNLLLAHDAVRQRMQVQASHFQRYGNKR